MACYAETMEPHLPIGIPGPLALGPARDGVELALNAQVLATVGIVPETCPHCGHRPTAHARWRSFVAGGTALFGRVRLCRACERAVKSRGDGKYVLSMAAGISTILAGAALGAPWLALGGLVATPAGLVVAALCDRDRRVREQGASLACLSVSRECVRLRAPRTWWDVLSREQPGILVLDPAPPGGAHRP